MIDLTERETLELLLKNWGLDVLTEREVHEEAEILWEEVAMSADYPEDDPRSITAEVLSQLSVLNWQLIVVDDIPAILAFLATPPGQEPQAWQDWLDYWKNIDFEQRRISLLSNPYYAKSPVPNHNIP